ncbi:hypothetical protein [Xenorhabdus szentirmaii]|uniref:Uncharacterized protein n=1 Tax=Xenorhabdus szentirmaii DSM 16338 TaxID=1427518 RepID=W1ITU8_9GAMM|nr:MULTISPECIES: hypothetical protein [Xenorhabdus]PHM30241.1 RHS repeat-associated core domain-containing protein [Xenorhabdus szentirmaii DSM 16338]PHM44399.1 RHS repeat-associated core domain-containing protein [Xenorhabdus szentirmaii]CDL81263.1 hypothetical protein XSR1_1180001 [Xenorhabdus szentirmaii DSM 16338]
MHNPTGWIDPFGLAGADCDKLKQGVLDNIAESKAGRESSNFPHAYNKSLEFDSNKFNYIFGRVNSNPHNTARSSQLAHTMKKLGIHEDAKGKRLLIEHFESSIQGGNNNVISVFRGHKNILQETRQSLLYGPSGKATVLESTYQIMENGSRKFLTVIPKD